MQNNPAVQTVPTVTIKQAFVFPATAGIRWEAAVTHVRKKPAPQGNTSVTALASVVRPERIPAAERRPAVRIVLTERILPQARQAARHVLICMSAATSFAHAARQQENASALTVREHMEHAPRRARQAQGRLTQGFVPTAMPTVRQVTNARTADIPAKCVQPDLT